MSVRILPSNGGSQVHVYARARFGLRDFGVNAGHVMDFAARLERALE